jgi:hypothetical protein
MFCYRFPDEQAFLSLAEAEGFVTIDENGKKSLITNTHSYALDTVGTITKGGEYDPETGEVITPPTVISGWHVNYAGEPPEAWEQYLVTPQHPARVWA